MRILWLRPSKGDNISVRRERIASELRKRGYKIDICDASGPDAISAIKQAICGNYDIIAGNVRVGLYLGYPLSRILQTPFLGDVSDPLSDIEYLPTPIYQFFEWYEWYVLQKSDATVFVYESSYQNAIGKGIDNTAKIPNGVNYDQFANPKKRIIQESYDILDKEGVDFEKPIAIYIGVLSDNYHIPDILSAARSNPRWEFIFVGEGPLERKVQEQADKIDNVHYPGAFEYELMPGFLSHSDVGFCFKDAEQPLKLKEYGAAGLPIIAQPGELSSYYGPDELLFVEPNNQAITDVLDQVLEDREILENYAEAGENIAQEWSWERIADSYDYIFTNLYKNGGGFDNEPI